MVRSSVLVLVAFAQLASGCSLVFTRHPSIPDDAAVRVTCPESRAAPIADTAITAALFGASAALIAYGATMDPTRNEFECASCFAYAMAVGPLAYGAVAGVTAKVGYDRTARCQRIHRWQRACLAGDREACRALQSE